MDLILVPGKYYGFTGIQSVENTSLQRQQRQSTDFRGRVKEILELLPFSAKGSINTTQTYETIRKVSDILREGKSKIVVIGLINKTTFVVTKNKNGIIQCTEIKSTEEALSKLKDKR